MDATKPAEPPAAPVPASLPVPPASMWDLPERKKLIPNLRSALNEWMIPFKKEVGIERINIMLAGPPGAGKSETINNFLSALTGRGVFMCPSGPASRTLTTTLFHFNASYVSVGPSGDGGKFDFWDTPGWPYGPNGQRVHDYPSSTRTYLFDGSLPHNTRCEGHDPLIPDRVPGFLKQPPLSQRPHVLIIVISAKQLTTEGVLDTARAWVGEARARNIFVVGLLTKVDTIEGNELPHQDGGGEMQRLADSAALKEKIALFKEKAELNLVLPQRNVDQGNQRWLREDPASAYHLHTLRNLEDIIAVCENWACFARQCYRREDETACSSAGNAAPPAPAHQVTLS